MGKQTNIFRSLRDGPYPVVALALLFGLSACSGLRLYDASKEATATSAKEQLAEAKVTEAVDAALENSQEYLEEAERIAGMEAEVRKERALLDIAESNRSMASWLESRWSEQAELGFESTASLYERLEAEGLVDGETQTAAKNRDRLKDYSKDPAVGRLLVGPLCEGITKQSERPETTRLDRFAVEFLAADFETYRKSCATLATLKAAVPDNLVSDSAISRAKQARADAIASRAEARERLGDARQKLNTALAALKDAQAKAEDGKLDLTGVRDKVGEVSKAAGEVADLAAKIGDEDFPLENIKNLAVILAAVSSGQVDKDTVANNEALAKASLAAAELPSLAEDAAALIAAGQALPTSHLVLELNHQQILYTRALEISNLWQEELSLHDRKIALLQEQARQFREVQYRLCNYATEKASEDHQGPNCAIMNFENEGFTCKIGPDDAQLTITDCVLAASWRTNYKRQNEPLAKRQLLAAFLAYSRALDTQAALRKADFQIIDLGHRRIIASNRAAIAAWNNLVAVPVDTLADYHAAGIKPDTIASALAQLLGLLGIAVSIGVSN